MSNDDARLKRTLDVSLTDMLALLHAVHLAATEAVCERMPLARRQFEALALQIRGMIPPEADMFEGLVLSEIGVALQSAAAVRLAVMPKRWEAGDRTWWDGQIEVSIKDRDGETRSYRTESDKPVHKDDEDKVRAVAAFIEDVAPLGVEIVLGREGEEFEIRPAEAVAP